AHRCAHVAAEEETRAFPAGGLAENDLQDDFVLALAQANAELHLRLASAAAHHRIDVNIVKVWTGRLFLVLFGLVRILLRAHGLGVRFLRRSRRSWWRRNRRVHHLPVEPHFET